MQKFRGIDTAYATQYANILGVSILLILSIAQYFRGVDTAYFMQYAALSSDRYCLYYTIRFMEVDAAYTKQYAVFFGGGYFFYFSIRSIFLGSILFIISNK